MDNRCRLPTTMRCDVRQQAAAERLTMAMHNKATTCEQHRWSQTKTLNNARIDSINHWSSQGVRSDGNAQWTDKLVTKKKWIIIWTSTVFDRGLGMKWDGGRLRGQHHGQVRIESVVATAISPLWFQWRPTGLIFGSFRCRTCCIENESKHCGMSIKPKIFTFL